MGFTINIEAPANGRIGTATVVVTDDDGSVRHTDKANLTADKERRRVAKAIADALGQEPAHIRNELDAAWTKVYDARLNEKHRQAAAGQQPTNEICTEVLDDVPQLIQRPLCLVANRGYAATWLTVQTTTRQTVNPETGEVRRHEPPLVESVQRLTIIRDDGCLFADGVPGAKPFAELGVEADLRSLVSADRIWSGAGVKRFAAGERPNPAKVFERVLQVIDSFMDFNRSLASQGTMCEMVACYVLGTYLLGAFNVVGYLWPNGDRGTGKTNLLSVVTEMAYLGLLILAGGSYASLRDLADYGATLAFDDAEGVMDVKRSDPDKRALLLAGNRRGATVTVKEQTADRNWATRHIHAFSNRLFSAIRLPDDVLGSRSIVVPLIRSADPHRAKQQPQDHAAWPCDRRRLVDDLWATGLAHLAELPGFDAEAARRARLSGRPLEPWRTILAVALWLQERHGLAGLHERLEKLSVDYQTERGDMEANDRVRVAIKALRQLVCGSEEPAEFTAKQLADQMNQIAVTDEITDGDKPFTTPTKVGKLLSQLRFSKVDRSARTRGWAASAAEVVALAQSYGVPLEPAEERFPDE
jgi:hypothetical protein